MDGDLRAPSFRRVCATSVQTARRGLVLWLGIVCVHAATLPPPKDWLLPPVDGEIEGEVNALLLGGAPKVKWKLAVRSERPRERAVTLSLEGHGLSVKGEARVDPMGEGTWRLTEALIDLGTWFGWVAPQIAPEIAGMTVSGQLRLDGEGTWREGKLGGRANVSLREGRVEDIVHKISMEGISVDVEIADLAKPLTAPEQVFTWRAGRYDVVALGVGRIEFMLDGEEIRVNNAAIDVFGGELRVGSLTMSTKRPEFHVQAQMSGVAVDQIMFLLPPVLSEAKGRLDGNVELRRDATGIQIGDGRLALRKGETADLRLAVKPGWLTTSLPPVIVKNFPGFRKIETGEIPIRARVLEITFTPAGDAQGRTGWIHLAGGPTDPELTAPIEMNVNMRGPLQSLVKLGADLGTDSRLRFGTGK